MSARDEEILASIGMSLEEVNTIAEACEAGNYEMWDSSNVSYGSPFAEEMTTISVRLPNHELQPLLVHKSKQE